MLDDDRAAELRRISGEVPIDQGLRGIADRPEQEIMPLFSKWTSTGGDEPLVWNSSIMSPSLPASRATSGWVPCHLLRKLRRGWRRSMTALVMLRPTLTLSVRRRQAPLS